MNIVRMARAPLMVALFLGTALGSMAQSHAGFQITDTGSSSSSTTPMVVSNVQMDGSPLPVETKAKGLEIFNDRYVPDSVRKKYNLDDSWYGKGTPSNAVPVIGPVSTPVSLAPPETEINSHGTISAAPLTANDIQPPATEMKAETKPETKAVVESWRGRKGENIRDVLQRWSTRSGASLMWASPDAPTLQKEFTYVGKYQDAVNLLIKTEGGDKIHSQYRSEGLNPVMMAPASTVTTNTPPAIKEELPVPAVQPAAVNPLAQIFQPEEKKDVKPETRWFALSGAPLAEVMKVWADDAGVQLIWQSERNFAVKESISQVGHFEDAVYRALNQYSAEDVRPVGEMYNNPQSGQQVLVVRTEVN